MIADGQAREQRDWGIENLLNLYGLWRAMGASRSPLPRSEWWVSDHWPNRLWCEGLTPPALEQLNSFTESRLILHLPHWGATLPLATALTAAGATPQFLQTAMSLSVAALPGEVRTPKLQIEPVTAAQLPTWVSIASQAFNYDIAMVSASRLLAAPAAQLLLAYKAGRPVATALWFRTGGVLGLHQFGVSPDVQGQGIARALLGTLLQPVYTAGAEVITLQASVAGRPLYEQVGFLPQFHIGNYRVSE